ncbi:lasso peptide biosynthesis B2 protein [Paenibacillus tarimensis]
MKLLRMPLAKQLLLVEAVLYLGWGRILKALPFSTVAPGLGATMVETSMELETANAHILKRVSWAVGLMSRHTWWESMCLVKAIAAMKMLERRKIESTLYLGTSRDGSGKMIAHAWLRSGPFYITGSEEMEKFTVVGIFGKSLHSLKQQGRVQNG